MASSEVPSSPWRSLVRTPLGAISLIMLGAFFALAVFAPVWFGDLASQQDIGAIQQGASAEHPFGTDALGRDLLMRTLVAARLSISLALLATAIGVIFGLILGLAPSVLPRRLGRLIVSSIDIAVAFPPLLLALFFAIIFGVGMTGAVLAIAAAIAPGFARITHTLATSVEGLDFVASARVSGVGRMRSLFRHILPNIGDPLVVNVTMIAGDALLAFAALSFLGIGVQAPDYDWGRIFNDGLALLYVNPMAALGPGLAILLAGLAFNLLGEASAQVIGGRAKKSAPRSRRTEPATHAPAAAEPDKSQAVRISNLRVALPRRDGWLWPVRGVSFSIRQGESVGLVGESGSGKSMTAMALSKLLEEPVRVTADVLEFSGTSLKDSSPSVQRALLGTRMAVVFQDPMTSFNPSQRMGHQLAEVSREHAGLSRRNAWNRAVSQLKAVKITRPEVRASQYPHEFSGGMRQRAMIAMGLMGEPTMIVADEPTTALDVTVQQQVLELLDEAKERRGSSLLLISHDIDLVAGHCDRVMVMYAGRVIEDLPAADLAGRSRHPYTRGLQASVPDFSTDRTLPLSVIPGRPPRLTEVGEGCAFAPRCINATEKCLQIDPDLAPVGPQHRVACWNPVDVEDSTYEREFVKVSDAR